MKSFLLLLALSTALLAPAQAQPVGVQTFAADVPLRAQFRLSTGRFGMPAVQVGTDIYVVGGYSPTGLSGSIEKIDTTNNTVSEVKPATPLLRRGFHSAEAVGDLIFIFGGQAEEDGELDFSNTVECFDTKTLKVTTVASLPNLLHIPASVEVGGKIYVVGGGNDVAERQKLVWIYDPQTNKWAQGASMRVARECDVVAADGVIYALGGYDGKNAVTTCEAYDIATDTWRDLPDLPIKTSAHHLALFGESVWAFGDYEELNRVQRFDLKTQTWQRVNQTGYDGRRHAAVCSVDEKIYVIGGNIASAGSHLDAVQMFDANKLK